MVRLRRFGAEKKGREFLFVFMFYVFLLVLWFVVEGGRVECL